MTRYAHSTFCDDVRQEIGNKTSLMGLYSGELFVQELPAALSKLCVVIVCRTSVEEPFTTLSVRLNVAGGDTVAEVALPPEALKQLMEHAKSHGSDDDPVRYMSVGTSIILSPYLIQEPHTLKAVAIADGEEYPAGRLRIAAADLRAMQPAARPLEIEANQNDQA